MSHYNPSDDPKVTNGIQEAYGFKRGDIVEYTNPQSLNFKPHTVIGFCEPEKRIHSYTELYSGEHRTEEIICNRTVYIDSDSPWLPVKPEDLRKII
jgi:hypothetical protein